MSITINSQLLGKLETRVDDLREAVDEGSKPSILKALERITKAFSELRGTATTATTSDAVATPKKGRKAKVADGEEKPKRAPTEWSLHCQNVLFPMILPIIKDAKAENREVKTGFHMRVAGYLKKNSLMNPTAQQVKDAFEFLMSNPDYQSDTQITRSASNSTAEAPKKRGRAKKTEKVEHPAPTPVAKPAEIIAKLESELSDDDSDDDEDDDEETPLEPFEFKGQNYLKDPYQEIYTAEGEMVWVGTFNGKKIVKGEMPARVKKFIDSQN